MDPSNVGEPESTARSGGRRNNPVDVRRTIGRLCQRLRKQETARSSRVHDVRTRLARGELDGLEIYRAVADELLRVEHADDVA